jgi:hypothetical protein
MSDGRLGAANLAQIKVRWRPTDDAPLRLY